MTHADTDYPLQKDTPSLCTARCNKCFFGYHPGVFELQDVICIYTEKTGHSKRCPCGTACEKFIPRRHYRNAIRDAMLNAMA